MSSYIRSLQVVVMASFSLAVFFAIKTFKRTLNQTDKDKQSCADLARKVAEKGDHSSQTENWRDAINFYTAAIKLDGSNATYYRKRATTNLCIRRLNHAIEDYDKASALDGIYPCKQHEHYHTVTAINVCRQDHHHVNVWPQERWSYRDICQNPDCVRKVSYGYPVSRQPI